MELTGWGRYPSINSKIITPLSEQDVLKDISKKQRSSLIVRGLGRSYGDSSLAPLVVTTSHLNHFISFDEKKGLLTCHAGVSLAEVLKIFVPKGWFLPVTPGTKFISIGGAVASDVHGKNHHRDGCFTDHIISLKIATVTQGIIECSRKRHPELFHATCGGIGLTGIILEATFWLKRIHSALINERTIRTKNLEDTLELFEEHNHAPYSVAWIDCLSTGKSLGRSILTLGEHSTEGKLVPSDEVNLNIPIDMPKSLLNHSSVKIFNTLYYHRLFRQQSERVVHYDSFFYPLDKIHQWNRLYGKKGFTQYQLVLPKEAGLEGMASILKRITASKRGSFLSVLKAFGKGNENYLSFPMEGYTLALDFKLEGGLFKLLDELDMIVLDLGGRLYLTKDARMSEDMFKKSYPQWEKFMEIRTRYGADKIFHSLQSQRLGL